MPSDRAISATRYDGGTVVQAFPLGGRVAVVEVSGDAPGPITGLADKSSLLIFRVPIGHTLYVGNAGQLAGLEGDDARDLMIDYPAGHYPFTLIEAEDEDVVVMGSADFILKIQQAATLGPENS